MISLLVWLSVLLSGTTRATPSVTAPGRQPPPAPVPTRQDPGQCVPTSGIRC